MWLIHFWEYRSVFGLNINILWKKMSFLGMKLYACIHKLEGGLDCSTLLSCFRFDVVLINLTASNSHIITPIQVRVKDFSYGLAGTSTDLFVLYP